MGKNGYIQRRQAMNQGFLDVGEQLGMQKMWDYIQLTLRDPDVMGKDTFGKKRLEKIYEHLKVLADRKIAAAEKKIVQNGLDTFTGYQRERIERLLGVDRCYELEEKFQRKEAEQQLSLFDEG